MREYEIGPVPKLPGNLASVVRRAYITNFYELIILDVEFDNLKVSIGDLLKFHLISRYFVSHKIARVRG